MNIAATLGPSIDDLYITSRLDQRTVRRENPLREKRALQELATRMLENPEDVLPRFVDLAMEMTGGVAAGLSLFEENPAPGVFRWRYLRGSLSPFENATTPRNFSPCGITLDRNEPVLSLHPERYYNWISDASIVVPEVLLVPLYLGGTEPLGTLWIVSEAEDHFDRNDARAMTELATFVGIALKMLRTEQNLHKALEEQETLTKEMSHRVKNLFAVATGMVRITARTSASVAEMAQLLTGRLTALAAAHGMIRRSFVDTPAAPRTPDLKALLQTIVEPHERHHPGAPARFSFDGPSVACGEHALNGMALMFHELVTNAAKYGALQTADGHVAIRWTQEDADLVMRWTESGGPEVAPPEESGFGSTLLNNTVTRQFQGSMAHDWHPGGLSVTLRLPFSLSA